MSGAVECQLCPKYCHVAPGECGDCLIRVNVDGRLVATTHGFPCAIHMDPMEKKPLFHFLPGTRIFSVATVGCNLHCRFCQNWSISQANPEDVEAYDLTPEEVVSAAREADALSIALTYTEPLVWYEYALDVCRLARDAGLKTVLVTAGFLNEKPLRELLRYVDAANVDLKAFTEEFYRDVCSAALRPVLRALEVFVAEGVWTEVTNLIVPTLNDDMDTIRKMSDWMLQALGEQVPLHFSRFSPRHKLRNLPPTPAETLEEARRIARAVGLRHVYIGNLLSRDGENTFCPNPGCPERSTALLTREGFTVLTNRLVSGRCPVCGTRVAGVWEYSRATAAGGAR